MVTHEPNHSEKVLLIHVCDRFNLLTINNNWFENLRYRAPKVNPLLERVLFFKHLLIFNNSIIFRINTGLIPVDMRSI